MILHKFLVRIKKDLLLQYLRCDSAMRFKVAQISQIFHNFLTTIFDLFLKNGSIDDEKISCSGTAMCDF